ncbi:MAG TPA: hypothetical protein VJZ71_14855 [Phycisphaerae bacterium]|nr:hypothetical protein [Phycisphaerae bacterium]
MDARKKKVVTVLCAASVILVWRVYVVVTTYLPSAAKAETPVAEAGPLPTEVAAATVAKARERESAALRTAQDQAARQPWGRDPFASLMVEMKGSAPAASENSPPPEAPTAPRLSFTGVARVDEEWRAIVSGQFVGIGDFVETDFRVSQITKRSITFQSRGWSLRYELGQDVPVVQPITENP